MHRFLSLWILLLCALSVSARTLSETYIDLELANFLASEREKLPVPGIPLYELNNLSLYNLTSNNGAQKSIQEAEEELPFELKSRLKVTREGGNAWEPQFQTPRNQIPIKEGDLLFYVFYIRTVDTEWPNDYGKTLLYSQRATSPWTGLGSLNLSLSTSWKKFYMTAKAESDFGIDEMMATFHLGYLQQIVEIGGLLALNLGQDITISDLPQNDITYGGMEDDADWRVSAAERIEEYRKSNIKLIVKDDQGNSLEGAKVSVQMKEHAYEFGTFLSDLMLENSSAGDTYRKNILEMFNVVTTPFYMGGNGDNWGWYGSSSSKTNYPKMAAWAKEVGLPAKGHVLIWPSWSWMPSYFENLKSDPSALSNAIYDHLELIVPIGKEKGLSQWDVVNEPFINHDIMDILGEEILLDWYNKVHELDSVPGLIINEYNILMSGGRADFQANFERLIQYLIEEGAPLDGIGMQGHFDELLTDIPSVLEILDRFALFGLPIQITEFDVSIRDEEMQAKYLKDFYTAVFSHPATEKIVMWGFYEKIMWKPLAALVRTDWTYKPNYHVYMDLIYHDWWTADTIANTNIDGVFAMRGFNGVYDITIEIEDSTYIISDTLITDEIEIEIIHGEVEASSFNATRQNIDEYRLDIHPNPFSQVTRISYTLPNPGEISLKIYDKLGKLVKSRKLQHLQPGSYSCQFHRDELEAGLYVCVLDAKGRQQDSARIAVCN